MLYAVIMAGGAGTRLWPSSRKSMPKQAIPLLGGESLFQRTAKRLEGVVPPERAFVITNRDQAELLAGQAPDIPRENIVGEPVARDSAAAVFLAAAITVERDADALNIVMPADHIISPVDRFQQVIEKAVRLAQRGHLVTLGIKPRFPATGYGYIERGAAVGDVEGAHRVVRFREKPDEAAAKEYIDSGRFYWNSGIFIWKASAILDAARDFAPDHYKAIRPLGKLFATRGFDEAVERAYEPLKRISVDYAVMEKAPNIAVVEADFDWSDVGSHVALRELWVPDEHGNIREGLTAVLDSSDCVVAAGDGHLVAVFGCKDIVVIHTADATLVCPASRAQDIKKLIAALETDNLKDYL